MAKTTKTAKKTTTGTTTKRAPASGKAVKKSAATIVMLPSEEQIRARAYEIFMRRNGAPGDADADWRQAEYELRQEMVK